MLVCSTLVLSCIRIAHLRRARYCAVLQLLCLYVSLVCLSVCLSVTCQYCVRITEPVVKQSDLGESPSSRILTVLTAYCLLLYFPFYFSGA